MEEDHEHGPGLSDSEVNTPNQQPSGNPSLATPEYSIPPDFTPRVDSLKTSLAFQRALEGASLDNGDLGVDDVYRLRHPVQNEINLLDDPDLLLSLRLFLSTTSASDQVYNDVRSDMLERHPEDNILSLASVKKKIQDLTGVIPIVHDMCPNSCVAYTGPYADLESCPMPDCQTSRYDPVLLESSGGKIKKPQQQFYTMPLGPQLQALWRNPETAEKMKHRSRRTKEIFEALEATGGVIEEYEDIYHGESYLEAVARGDITPDDMVLMFAMDGAQLYQDKQSDCWIYMWVVFDLAPDLRYRKRYVLPGGFIPGPNNPKNSDSYLFPGFHHLAAIQKEGLNVWDGKDSREFISRPFLHLGGADGPGSVHFTGLVGHHGAFPCRLYCDLKGRHVPGAGHYYPALHKPLNYTVAGSDHPDVDPDSITGGSPGEYHRNLLYLLESRHITEYKERRKQTGIAYPSLFGGLPSTSRQPIPAGFPGDSMHGPMLNMGDLLLPLWRKTFRTSGQDTTDNWDWGTLVGDVWKAHGSAVAACREYIPGFIDHPPRNIAEKINSGYKAKEWQTYLYGLAPALLFGILPERYWKNFCKLVYAIRLLHQRTIKRSQLQEAHKYLKLFCVEYEEIYVQRRSDRLHMVRPSVHGILHMPSETVRVGPTPLSSTWTMERLIGDLGSEIRQPSNPYQNLSQRGLRRCQINALIALFPFLDRTPPSLPRYSLDIGDGYVLLRAKERTGRLLSEIPEHSLIRDYLEEAERIHGNLVTEHNQPHFRARIPRWARLRLPNGQTARSAWKEESRAFKDSRRARCVKVFYCCLFCVIRSDSNNLISLRFCLPTR